MRAGTYEVQSPVTRVPVGGPQVRHLRQHMRQAVGGTFHQVSEFERAAKHYCELAIGIS